MNTVMEAAFRKAGIDASGPRLAVAANNILGRVDKDPLRALPKFLEAIETDAALLRALALAYLQDRAADMRGHSLPGGGQLRDGAQTKRAPSRQTQEDDAGQEGLADRASDRMPASPAPPADGGRQLLPARVAIPELRPPSAPRGLAAIASIQPAIARSVLDTFKVRDGRSVGDLAWHELLKFARANEHEARVLRFIEQHVANADPFALVRTVVSARTVEEAIKIAGAVNAD